MGPNAITAATDPEAAERDWGAAATGSAVGMGNAATVGGTTTVGDTAAMGDATSEGIHRRRSRRRCNQLPHHQAPLTQSPS